MKNAPTAPAEEQPPLIDESIVAAFSNCERKAFLLLQHRAQGSSPPPPPDYAGVLVEQASTGRAAYVRNLAADQQLTARQNGRLDDGLPFLWNVSVVAGGLSANYSLLRRVTKPSKLGRFSYEPVVFGGTSAPAHDQMVTLSYLGHVLGERQGLFPTSGTLVTPDGSGHKVNLASHQKAATSAIEVAGAWRSGNFRDAPAAVLNKHCAMCQFRAPCEAKAIAEDDLSLLHRMTPKLRRRYEKKGIFTVNQLSYVFRPRKNRKTPRHAAAHFNVELQALALRKKKTYVHEEPRLSRHPVELFLDMEGVPDRRLHYLIGLLVVDHRRAKYQPYWADSAQNEREIWRAFVAAVKRYPDAPIYHYGSYERKAIADLADRHGHGASGLEQRLVNLSAFVFGNIYFPVRSNTLKEIGRFLGAQWTSVDASGLQSLVWRHEWERSQERKHKNLLVQYNEDDCRALKLLADSITRIGRRASDDLNIEFSHRPKQHSSEVSTPIHAEFGQILKSAQLVYKTRRIKIWDGSASPEGGGPQRKRTTPRLPLGRVKVVQVSPKRMCPCHRGEKLSVSKKRSAKAIVTDLVFSGGGCRRVVTKYVGPRGFCNQNCHYYNPPQISRLGGRRFGNGFYAWVAYSRVVLRLPFDMITHVAQDMMRIQAPSSTLVNVFRDISECYRVAQRISERRIVESKFVHADETRLNIRGRDQYVWVFTDGERVAFRLTETRESDLSLRTSPPSHVRVFFTRQA